MNSSPHSKQRADHKLFKQNKKRKYGRDKEDQDDQERTPEPEDPLKDAATLYVGNLFVWIVPHERIS